MEKDKKKSTVKVAIEGCCHGELNKIYQAIEERGGADIVLICGDFQSIRNENDLNCLSVPKKYLKMNDFHEYYSGKKKANYLTIFIGGNHEASNYLSETFYGGWVAPNIYYLGKAGSVIFNGLRISGVSGIYKENDHYKGHYEKPPYNPSTIRSVYHTRYFEISKLSFLPNKPDIMLSHDWPNNIEKYGNCGWLIRTKPFFKNEINSNQLGNPATEYLLHTLRPRFWFSAHLHVRFFADVNHSYNDQQNLNKKINAQEDNINPDVIELDLDDNNPDEIELDLDNLETEIIDENQNMSNFKDNNKSTLTEASIISDSSNINDEIKFNGNEVEVLNNLNQQTEGTTTPKRSFEHIHTPEITHFLALDKCLNNRKFLEIKEIEVLNETIIKDLPTNKLCYDLDWLAVTKVFHPYLNQNQEYDSNKEIKDNNAIQEEIKKVKENLISKLKLNKGSNGYPIPENFKVEAPTSLEPLSNLPKVITLYPNSQTQFICDLLDIKNIFTPPPSV